MDSAKRDSNSHASLTNNPHPHLTYKLRHRLLIAWLVCLKRWVFSDAGTKNPRSNAILHL